MSAAQQGHKPVVELLIDRGANVGTKTATGDIALFLAAKGNHWNVVRMLI
ncbi:ankyrin repeat domain-containing protein [Endozoicomonas sp.]